MCKCGTEYIHLLSGNSYSHIDEVFKIVFERGVLISEALGVNELHSPFCTCNMLSGFLLEQTVY